SRWSGAARLPAFGTRRRSRGRPGSRHSCSRRTWRRAVARRSGPRACRRGRLRGFSARRRGRALCQCGRTHAARHQRLQRRCARRAPDSRSGAGDADGLMATAVIDGVTTRYEIVGSGTPLLMFSPGGFDATLEKWTTLGVYARIKILDHLSKHYRCIIFDRRESGQSGGRVERVTWAHYARQGYGLLRHLAIDRAHVMGGCAGCSSAIAFGVAYPKAASSLLLWWPVGGARYRINGHLRFTEHLAYVKE